MVSSQKTARGNTNLIILALALGTFAIGVGEFTTMGLLLEMSRGLGISETQVGSSISFYAIGVFVGAPAIAFFGSRIKRKKLLILLALLYGIAHVGTALATNYWTLLLARFISGIPHGAYFGVATLLAASVSEPSQKGAAVSKVMMGLSVAILIGNPLSVWLGQHFSWRLAFAFVGAIAFLAMLMISMVVPAGEQPKPTSFKRELKAFNTRPVWLALILGMVGFAGMFSVFSYLAPTLQNLTKESDSWMPLLVIAFGAGSIVGMYSGGKLVDRYEFNSVRFILIWAIVVLGSFPFAASTLIGITIGTFAVGTLMAMPVALQSHLMEVSGNAQVLGAAANQSALNGANALGPWLAGMALNAGLGYTSPGFVGVASSVLGLIIFKLASQEKTQKSKTAYSER